MHIDCFNSCFSVIFCSFFFIACNNKQSVEPDTITLALAGKSKMLNTHRHRKYHATTREQWRKRLNWQSKRCKWCCMVHRSSCVEFSHGKFASFWQADLGVDSALLKHLINFIWPINIVGTEQTNPRFSLVHFLLLWVWVDCQRN